MNKQIILTEEEARAVVTALKSSLPPMDMIVVIYKIVDRIERELAT